ncbi:MAG: glycosyltransferase family 4 protein [Pyrinomonadaceae bacterium]
MKILHTVEFYHPSVGGTQEVVKQISERLVKSGHDVTIATTQLPERNARDLNGVRIEEFEVSGNAVRGLLGETKKYERFLVESNFDVVTNFAAQQWATDVMLPLLDCIEAKKVFVPTGFSGLYLPAYKEYFEAMKAWMRKYDMNVFLSDDYRDINFARECGLKNFTVIPNGASEEEFNANTPHADIRRQMGIAKDCFLILHVGSHTGAKGHAEAIEIFRRARIENAALLIVGNDFGDGCAGRCAIKMKLFKLSPKRLLDDKTLIVASLSRKDTIAAYLAADCFLFPSNVECSPLVLFECMASKTPFLTADVGNAAEIIEWSKAGRLLPTQKDSKGNSKAEIKSSAAMLTDIYNRPDEREAMQHSGYEEWSKRFTWARIAQSYEEMYRSLLLPR